MRMQNRERERARAMEENTSICFLQFSSLNNFLVFYFPANELNSRVFNHFLGIRRQLSVLESKKSLACKNNFNIDRYRRRKNGVLTGIFHPRDRKHGELSERKIAGWGDGGGGASGGMGWIKINSIVFTYEEEKNFLINFFIELNIRWLNANDGAGGIERVYWFCYHGWSRTHPFSLLNANKFLYFWFALNLARLSRKTWSMMTKETVILQRSAGSAGGEKNLTYTRALSTKTQTLLLCWFMMWERNYLRMNHRKIKFWRSPLCCDESFH